MDLLGLKGPSAAVFTHGIHLFLNRGLNYCKLIGFVCII
jgi:hypothetical protein